MKGHILGFQEGVSGFQHLLETLPVAAYTCNLEGAITGFNQHAVKIWGSAPCLDEIDSRFCGPHQLLSASGSPMAPEQCAVALALKTGQETIGQEVIVRRRDGSEIGALFSAKPICDAAGRLEGVIGVLVDISDQKRASHVLQNEVNEYRRVEQRIHESNEREQSRLVNLLHEDLAQQLTALALFIGVLHRHLSQESHSLTSQLGELSKMASECIAAARNLAKGVYPLDLADGGLVTALEHLAQKTEIKFGVSCKVLQVNWFQYEDSHSIYLYRIVQGVISGAINQFNPTKIGIECKTEADISTLIVTYNCTKQDDESCGGSGWDLDLVNSRVRLIGASLEFETSNEGGKVICRLRNSEDLEWSDSPPESSEGGTPI